MALAIRTLMLALVALMLTGCNNQVIGYLFNSYDNTKSGKLAGKLILEWIDQDKFRYVPDPSDPLRFVRANKQEIKPGEMFTDGGSIPGPLRALKSFSPWGYAPAFIIHDWLFVMKHCKIAGHDQWDHLKAADVFSEVMKTVMESPKFGGPNKLVHYSMYEGVRSDIAKDYWDDGNCATSGGIMRSPTRTVTTRSAPGRPSVTRSIRSAAPAKPTRMRTVVQY